MLNKVSPARVAAFDALKEIEGGKFSSVVLANTDHQLSSLDRALCHELVLGVLRWQLQLDAIIEHFAKRQVGNIDPPVLRALRLAIYQIRFLSRIPASAAVNESVSLVGRARLSSARSFVNAVLRRVAREPDYSPAAEIADPLERIAIETSHPPWLIERWTNDFGIEQTELMARANNEPPPIAIRVVKTVADESEVVDKLRSAGAELVPSEIAKGAWRVSGVTARVRELSERGEIYIQDEASQLVAEVLNAQPGDRVLDVCAAPGGKTALIAERAGDRAEVIGMDVSPRRLSTIARTIELHLLKRIRLIVGDADVTLPFEREAFDRVLLDAPCSGTGTLRHNPEIRWRLTNEDISQLAAQQKRFLMNAAAVVKPGGWLVYSTCSIELEENEEVVRNFLLSNGQFTQVRVPANEELLTNSGAARTWPHRQGVDGFFIAALERK
ncbi:MAG TPA: 16S rRNA (cytosine(967)-C(5))-methyltransferase RsmB [Pyrinomonadaceae bacterium]|nr:16S rRNA (cytosine(967)-C(5))-methyltransferase RsmB [Pyrinomonadaceae bacterium]